MPSKVIEITDDMRKTGADLKIVKPENMHITLKFLGDIDESLVGDIEGIIRGTVHGLKPFEITLKGMGFFPNEKYIKVVWIGVENGEQIQRIATGIDVQLSKLGFKRERRGFSPHITVARLKSSRNKDRLLSIVERYKNFRFKEAVVDSVKLKKSDLKPSGPVYTDILEIKLGGGGK